MAKELLNALYIKPFTSMIPYLTPTSSLMVSDFEKSSLVKDHWLDLQIEDSKSKGRKRHDANHVVEVFGSFSDHEVNEVRQEMMSSISKDFNYYQEVSWLSLQMHKTTLSAWCTTMQDPTTPTDVPTSQCNLH